MPMTTDLSAPETTVTLDLSPSEQESLRPRLLVVDDEDGPRLSL